MCRAGQQPRRIARDDRGEIIPTAILYPLAMFAVFAGVQISMIFQARDAATDAAQRAATAESAYQATPGAGADAAEQALAPYSSLLVNSEVTVITSATDVRVIVTGDVVGWLGLQYPVSQEAWAAIERFTTESTP